MGGGDRDNPGGETTAPSAGGSGARRVRVRQLKVLAGEAPLRATACALGSEPLWIGRKGHVEGLALGDTEVSRRHAVLEPEGEAWFVRDLGSRNGTHVDGEPITTRTRLLDQTVLRVGRTLLLYIDVELPGDAPLAGETPRLLGGSLAVQRLRGELAQVAPRELPVLILGETGVGKEVVAAELHARSQRSGPLVPVNCAAIPAALAESELFGHAAGSFTGARGKSEGLFQAAAGGTLFLDEVGELPLELQPKLLRALATGEVRAVGATQAAALDVRVVAATNRDLDALVAKGSFRADLLARLAGWTVRVPPLRQRRDDVLPLAQAFLARAGGSPLAIEAAEALLVHDWPANVRELEQVMAVAAVKAAGRAVGREDLPERIAALVPGAPPVSAAGEPAPGEPAEPAELAEPAEPAGAPSREELERVLAACEGNVVKVAEHFAKDRQQIYRWARRHGIDMNRFRRR